MLDPEVLQFTVASAIGGRGNGNTIGGKAFMSVTAIIRTSPGTNSSFDVVTIGGSPATPNQWAHCGVEEASWGQGTGFCKAAKSLLALTFNKVGTM